MSFLLCAKVHKDAKDMLGQTPLDLAIAMDHRDIVELLTFTEEESSASMI